jgi:hypothetical protein
MTASHTVDHAWRASVLEAHGHRCFVCGRGPRLRQPLVAFLHEDSLSRKGELVRRAACRRCWGIATGVARAEKGALTKELKAKQLRVPGVAA